MKVEKRGKSRRFVFIVGLFSFLVLGALLYPLIRTARRAAQRMERHLGLMQVGMALHNFHDTYKRFPPAVRQDEAGRELCSWRYQILPFLESDMLAIDFSDRWDDPANRFLSARPHHAYCWSPDAPFPKSLHTSIVAITGPGTVFDGDRQTSLSDIDSDTILVVEFANSDTHWMEPGDLSIENVPDSIAHGLDGDGLFVLFADASVWFISFDVPLADLKKFFTIEGAKRYDREQLLGRKPTKNKDK